MIFETFPVGMLQCNCTILGDDQTREAIVIDPGDDPDVILEVLKKHKLVLKHIVCTHAHIDHVGAIYDLQERVETPASIHKKDLYLLDHLEAQARWIGMPTPQRGNVERYLEDGDAIACTGVELGVIHTPGHTPGSLTFQFSKDRTVLFTGDTLFLRSVGRTDLPGGSHPELIASIRNKLLTFDDDALVIPGHGQPTTIGAERHYNPFLT